MKRQKFLWTLAAVLAVLGTVCHGVTGMRFSATLLWCATLAVIACAVLERLADGKRWARFCVRALSILICAGLVFFFVLEARVVAGAHTDAEGKDVSCVVILGAGVDGTAPSMTLKTRLDAALAYLADKPGIPVIVSGGQGSGESITEAECMARYLTAHGVDGSRIWKEERSTSTRENFDFSYELMAQNGIDMTAGFAFVTSDFHICRAKRMAGVPWAYGVAARLPGGAYYGALEINYFIREAFGLAHELVFGW